jgi:polysaccharide export outer membrane protein
MTNVRTWPAVYGSILVIAAACLCAAPQASHAAKSAPEAPVESAEALAYRIQPGDILHVLVWNEKDLQAEVLVRPDGGISFPLAGDLKAAGDTITALAEDLTGRISKFIPDPVVTVAVKAINGNHIYVVGKVNHPGEFPAGRPIDVMQALALAGGTTPYAALSDIRILRREGGRQVAIKFDYTEVEKGRALDSNVLLKAGDTVVIP